MGPKRVKVDWQRVQLVLEVHERQLVMTDAQEVQVEGGVRY